eukprot:6052960-Pleurochrysis_carterae.AAC.1
MPQQSTFLVYLSEYLFMHPLSASKYTYPIVAKSKPPHIHVALSVHTHMCSVRSSSSNRTNVATLVAFQSFLPFLSSVTCQRGKAAQTLKSACFASVLSNLSRRSTSLPGSAQEIARLSKRLVTDRDYKGAKQSHLPPCPFAPVLRSMHAHFQLLTYL